MGDDVALWLFCMVHGGVYGFIRTQGRERVGKEDGRRLRPACCVYTYGHMPKGKCWSWLIPPPHPTPKPAPSTHTPPPSSPFTCSIRTASGSPAKKVPPPSYSADGFKAMLKDTTEPSRCGFRLVCPPSASYLGGWWWLNGIEGGMNERRRVRELHGCVHARTMIV